MVLKDGAHISANSRRPPPIAPGWKDKGTQGWGKAADATGCESSPLASLTQAFRCNSGEWCEHTAMASLKPPLELWPPNLSGGA